MLYVKRPAAMNFWMENLLFIAFRISVSQLIRAFDSSQYSQGHPTTVFCKISVRRSKYCLEISIAQKKLKISR